MLVYILNVDFPGFSRTYSLNMDFRSIAISSYVSLYCLGELESRDLSFLFGSSLLDENFGKIIKISLLVASATIV